MENSVTGLTAPPPHLELRKTVNIPSTFSIDVIPNKTNYSWKLVAFWF